MTAFAQPTALWLALLTCCSSCLGQDSNYGQFAPPDAFENGSSLAYYGSENEWGPRQFTEDEADSHYKRRGQRQILLVLNGKIDEAIESCEKYLAEDDNDLESLFTLSIAQCQLGDTDAAFATMHRAIAAGLPFERYLAGPRELLAPLTSTNAFRDFAARHRLKLLHGPMLGAVTDTSAQIWVRTAEECDVTARLFAGGSSQPIDAAPASSSKSMDYTARIVVEGLKPDTKYSYDVLIDGTPATGGERPSFRTFPTEGKPAQFRVAFGGCAGYAPQHERMWDTIRSAEPLAMLMLGDNVYIDLPTEAGPLHRYTYYRRQSRPEFRRLTQSIPMYAIWDDHDAAVDDIWLGPYRGKPSWKPSMLKLQQENWANPSWGDPDWPACWFRFAIGDVDFFMLDCRYYRTNPFGKNPTMLGSVQKKWLLDGLKESTATFRIIASSVAWASGAKPGSHDTWDGFPREREEIFSWIDQNHISGVVLLSADRHRSEAWKIPRPDGYALYDLLSSRLTNIHVHEEVEGAMFAYNDKCSFAALAFDTTLDDPVVKYTIVSIDGEPIHSLTLRQSELTAPSKQSDEVE